MDFSDGRQESKVNQSHRSQQLSSGINPHSFVVLGGRIPLSATGTWPFSAARKAQCPTVFGEAEIWPLRDQGQWHPSSCQLPWCPWLKVGFHLLKLQKSGDCFLTEAPQLKKDSVRLKTLFLDFNAQILFFHCYSQVSWTEGSSSHSQNLTLQAKLRY